MTGREKNSRTLSSSDGLVHMGADGGANDWGQCCICRPADVPNLYCAEHARLIEYADFRKIDVEIDAAVIKAAYDYFRQRMLEIGIDIGCAHPSLPVFVHGFQECPDCGHIFRLADKDKK